MMRSMTIEGRVAGRTDVRTDARTESLQSIRKEIHFLIAILAGVLALALAEAVTAAPSTPAPPPHTAKSTPAAKHEKAAKVGSKTGQSTSKYELPREVKKLIINDIAKGPGEDITTGQKLKVQYTGWLYDPNQPEGRGAQFDTTAGGAPFEFVLGTDRIIKGWEEGLAGMKVGGKRRLLIPAEMGYGSRGAGDKVPPDSPLLYEVEVMAAQKTKL
jgi:FKBP-type peptidyl-prolyl cis-trans isomerase